MTTQFSPKQQEMIDLLANFQQRAIKLIDADKSCCDLKGIATPKACDISINKEAHLINVVALFYDYDHQFNQAFFLDRSVASKDLATFIAKQMAFHFWNYRHDEFMAILLAWDSIFSSKN